MEGWVRFHRKIEEWEWFTDPNTFRVFFYLVLKANHKDREWRGIEIKRGQLITSRDKIAVALDLSPQQIRTSLKKLQSTNEITIESTNKYSIVTIEKYADYQDNQPAQQPTEQPSNNQPDNHQITTNKNVKNNKNEKKYSSQPKWADDSIEFRLASYLFKYMLKNNPDAKKPDLQKWCTHIDRMIRLDKRKPDQIKSVIEFCQKDEFWKVNILSTEKLRKQYDKLLVKMNSNSMSGNKEENVNANAPKVV